MVSPTPLPAPLHTSPPSPHIHTYLGCGRQSPEAVVDLPDELLEGLLAHQRRLGQLQGAVRVQNVISQICEGEEGGGTRQSFWLNKGIVCLSVRVIASWRQGTFVLPQNAHTHHSLHTCSSGLCCCTSELATRLPKRAKPPVRLSRKRACSSRWGNWVLA